MSKIKNKVLFIVGSGLLLIIAIPIYSSGSHYHTQPVSSLIAENSVSQEKVIQPEDKTADKFEAELRALSEYGEKDYADKILGWLKTLPNNQEKVARTILREVHPELQDLRRAIYEKRLELAAISFDRKTKPETLPKLGQELQYLRKSLRSKLEKVNERLREEAGITMGPLLGEGLWLQPLSRDYLESPKNEKKHDSRRELNLVYVN